MKYSDFFCIKQTCETGEDGDFLDEKAEFNMYSFILVSHPFGWEEEWCVPFSSFPFF